jgi:NADPH-dependent 2,4-dienoyl-CoA reductase/sulfur reductase-like enzyme
MKRPDGSDDRRFVIVGGGAAGSAAAETLRREGYEGRITMITADTDLPYDRPELSKGLLTGEAEIDWLPLRGPEFYEELEIDVKLETVATGLDPEKRRVHLSRGEPLPYDRLLIATGGRARRLRMPGSEHAMLLRTQADGLALLDSLQEARRVVILGAGFVGLEVASAMRKRGLEVTVVAPEKLPLAGIYGQRFGRRIQELHEATGAVFRLGSTATEIEATGTEKQVQLSDGSRLIADLVLMGVGIELNTDWLESAGLVHEGTIPVSETMETRAAGVFAAGDLAAVDGLRVEHWAVAQNQGRHAALAMMGRPLPYREVPFFWSIQADSVIKYVGRITAEPDQIVFRGSLEDDGFVAGYYSGGRLTGAASLNRSWDMIALQSILGSGGTVEPEHLSDLNRSLLDQAGVQAAEE